MVLACLALALAACQVLGLSGSIGAGRGNAATASAASEPAVAADAAIAATTANAYLDALTAGRYEEAWLLLAPASQQAWGSERQFAAERGAFYASAGPRVVVSPPDDSAETLTAWITPAFDGNRQRAYVVAVDHPQIESNASREVLIVAADSSGRWLIWIGR
jgi:hypothetical protein